MKRCIDCNGDVRRGWTGGASRIRCCLCETARALGPWPLMRRKVKR